MDVKKNNILKNNNWRVGSVIVSDFIQAPKIQHTTGGRPESQQNRAVFITPSGLLWVMCLKYRRWIAHDHDDPPFR